jgi:hypothetical protein
MRQLDQLIEGLEVGVSAFAICEVRQDAKFILKEETNTAVHYVLSGNGVAWQSGGRKFALKPHTVMIVPPGSLVVITNEKATDTHLSDPDCEPLPEDWDSLTVGNGEPGITLVCGFIRAMHLATTGLFDHLREPLVIDVADDTSFRAPFRQLLDELAAPRAGTRVLAELLMKQCLISLLRRQGEKADDGFAPWVAAVGNPELGRTIAAITDKPEADHKNLRAHADGFCPGGPAAPRRALPVGHRHAGKGHRVSRRLFKPQPFLARLQIDDGRRSGLVPVRGNRGGGHCERGFWGRSLHLTGGGDMQCACDSRRHSERALMPQPRYAPARAVGYGDMAGPEFERFLLAETVDGFRRVE